MLLVSPSTSNQHNKHTQTRAKPLQTLFVQLGTFNEWNKTKTGQKYM